ncbi:MAG: hypothetical protein ACREVJ_11505, partial [Gammaproteobacteria bacterium]
MVYIDYGIGEEETPMPWKETCAMDQRVQFIGEWLSGEYSKIDLCEFYGISRPWVTNGLGVTSDWGSMGSKSCRGRRIAIPRPPVARIEGCGNFASHLRSNPSIFFSLNPSQIACNVFGSSH